MTIANIPVTCLADTRDKLGEGCFWDAAAAVASYRQRRGLPFKDPDPDELWVTVAESVAGFQGRILRVARQERAGDRFGGRLRSVRQFLFPIETLPGRPGPLGKLPGVKQDFVAVGLFHQVPRGHPRRLDLDLQGSPQLSFHTVPAVQSAMSEKP